MNIPENIQRFQSLSGHAMKEARSAGIDFLTFIGVHERSSRDRIINGQVLQPKDSEGYSIQLVLWRKGRSMTMNVQPDEIRISSAIAYAKKVIDREEFPASEIVPPEGPYTGGYDTGMASRSFDPSVAELSHEKAVGIIKQVRGELESHDLIMDGVFVQGISTMFIRTSHGTEQAHESTSIGFSVYAFDREEAESLGKPRLISAFGYRGGNRFEAIDLKGFADDLARKCKLQRGRSKWNPFAWHSHFTGEEYFDVILEPPFIGDVLTWLMGYGGLNGKFYLQGESFLSGKMGKKVFGENITVWDDPFHPDGIVTPFDWEGVPKKRMLMVEKGVLRNVCYDTTLAKKAGTKSTGHAIPASAAAEFGAAPENLYIEGGEHSLEDMIRASQHPTVWITKVHYLGLKHFQTGTLTGTAQHGVFLVANGEVICPVENLRFEMPIPEALNRVTHLGKPQLIGGTLGGESPYMIPPMRIEGFRFIGATGRTS